MDRQNFAGNSPFESVIGYSRIVKVGPFIYVAGTTATNDEGKIVGVDDAYEQTKQIFRNIEAALNRAGGSFKDVVRTRMFVVSMQYSEAVGRAHGEPCARGRRQALTTPRQCSVGAPGMLAGRAASSTGSRSTMPGWSSHS